MSAFSAPSEKQVAYMRSLADQLRAQSPRKVAKPSRWNNPALAHQQHLETLAKDIAKLDTGELNQGQVSACIDTYRVWLGR